jgi:4-amino-4-deoxy-L-arabinose transferase-like glycosyltransferase
MEKLKEHGLFFVIFIGIVIFYIWGISLVPFHPDESTQLYMSQDFVDYFTAPLSLSYQTDQTITPKVSYRALDAPITKYLIGLSRLIFQSPEHKTDWDWSTDWETNLKTGAFPSRDNLRIARIIPTSLSLISIIVCYFAFNRFLPKYLALLSVLYFALNPLMLLHGRRAMAEPALVLSVSIFMFMIINRVNNPFVLGAALAVGFNSKQTAIALLPAAIIAIYLAQEGKSRLIKSLIQSIIMIGTIGVITYLLNPFYWQQPIQALKTSLQLRGILSDAHLKNYLGGEIPSLFYRFATAIANLFINKLSFSEINNLPTFMMEDITRYESVFIHDWGRNIILGSLFLSFIFLGIYHMFKRSGPHSQTSNDRSYLFYLSLALLTIVTLIALPIPWQRYILPLLPYTTLSIALGFIPLIQKPGETSAKNDQI